MSIQIVNKKPEGYRAHTHRVPLAAAKNIAEKQKGAVLVNAGGGRYSVYVRREAVSAPAPIATNSALGRAILGGE